jgi:hypothetical protein
MKHLPIRSTKEILFKRIEMFNIWFELSIVDQLLIHSILDINLSKKAIFVEVFEI